MVELALNGNNTCCFVYGVTGTGKTHTLYKSEEDPGLVLRVAEELWEGIRDRELGLEVKMSMYCLYNSALCDLLDTTKKW